MVRVKNIHTGVESTFTDAEWANVQTKKMWQDTFKVVEAGEEKKTEVPKEIADLQAGKTTQEQGAADVVNEEQAPAVPVEVQEAAKAPADKPAAAKKTQATGNKK